MSVSEKIAVINTIVSSVLGGALGCWIFVLWQQVTDLTERVASLAEALRREPMLAKPLPSPGVSAMSDAELAARERQQMATSRARARVLDEDARVKWTRAFRRGFNR